MKDIVINVLSSWRSSMELRFLEMTQFKTVKHSKKFYQILGFDIMFDENFNAWLFEVNALPSMNIFHHVDKADGTSEKEESEVDETIKTTIFKEAAAILIGKQESKILELVYDSEQNDSALGGIYEAVYAIYKKLWGFRLGRTISSSKFAKLAAYLPKSMKVKKIDLEIMFTKLQHDESVDIGLISFFTALVNLADKENNGDLLGLIESVWDNMQE